MNALQILVNHLHVNRIGENQFVGSAGPGSFRVYGGLIVAQALDAIRQCCPESFEVQSLHGQFLRPGDHDHAIDIRVEELKDGRRFKLYNVYCNQQGKNIFFATVTFHRPEVSFVHSLEAPAMNLPGIDKAVFYAHRQCIAGESHTESAIEVRIDEDASFCGVQNAEQINWFKTTSSVVPNLWQQTLLLAYCSDWNMPNVAMRPHVVPENRKLNIASLDHSIWFYRQPDLAQWTAYFQESPVCSNSRGHTRGLFYNQKGEMLACVNQESFLQVMPK